ncbi:MAG: aminodeoxychorismate/anthranilate synthase component II [Methanothrix sp.]|nr:MAG: aminodeoxychorismate/anthranilate synthase component II [Methanothrix sp.]
MNGQSRQNEHDRQNRPILFVDNQDSFVWNLVDYVSVFYENTIVRSNRITPAEVKALQPQGIVISPGPGHPASPRDIGSCLEIIRQFDRTPILGVCLGHQAMNLVYGGTISHTKPLHGKTSEIRHDGLGIFRGVDNPLQGGRYHSLAVETLAPDLVVSASTADGVVMGIRHRTRPHCGVQFHPESVLTPSGKKIISNWVEDVMGCTP